MARSLFKSAEGPGGDAEVLSKGGEVSGDATPFWDSEESLNSETWGDPEDPEESETVEEPEESEEPEEGVEEPEEEVEETEKEPPDPVAQRLDALERENAHLRGNFSPAAIAAAVTQGLTQQQQPRGLPPVPVPSIPDPEKLLTDSDALQNALASWSEYGFQRALRELTPYVHAQNSLMQVQGPALEAIASAVWREATSNLDAESSELEKVRPQVEEIIARGSRSAEDYQAMRLNPVSVGQALKVAQEHGLIPAASRKSPSKRPPSTPKSQGPSVKTSTVRKPSAVRTIEQNLGVKFTDSEVREFMKDNPNAA